MGNKVKIIPLGGLGLIGMNMTAFEYNDTIIVVDCGIAFPEDDMFGIDLVIPDVTYLKNNIDKVKAFVITHGHEDHIGALPYVLKEVNVPVLATPLTMGLIEGKLAEHELTDVVVRQVVYFNDVVPISNDLKVEFIRTNHSIVDAAALAIHTPCGTIVHTGDFKVDYTPVYGDAIDLQRFAELGCRGVLALLSDSTNAERPGITPSEKTVKPTFEKIFAANKDRRLIVATFASNVDRVQQVIDVAHEFDRKVVVEGRSMVKIIEVAKNLGKLNVPDNTLVDIENLKDYPDEKTVIVTTGSQGESMAALSRMAKGIHRKIKISPTDTIIFSSHPIPGNEKAVTKVVNELSAKGAEVVIEDAHVSGHACKEELKLIYSLTTPKYAIPVHGEYRHLKANAGIAEALGVEKENIFILKTGDVLALDADSARVVDHVHTGEVFVDGIGVGDVGNAVMRDRQKLAEDGIVIVSVTLDSENNVISGPEIITRGFVYVKESEDLIYEATEKVCESFNNIYVKNITDWNKIKSIIKDDLSALFWERTQRKPMILPIFMSVD